MGQFSRVSARSYTPKPVTNLEVPVLLAVAAKYVVNDAVLARLIEAYSHQGEPAVLSLVQELGFGSPWPSSKKLTRGNCPMVRAIKARYNKLVSARICKALEEGGEVAANTVISQYEAHTCASLLDWFYKGEKE